MNADLKKLQETLAKNICLVLWEKTEAMAWICVLQDTSCLTISYKFAKRIDWRIDFSMAKPQQEHNIFLQMYLIIPHPLTNLCCIHDWNLKIKSIDECVCAQPLDICYWTSNPPGNFNAFSGERIDINFCGTAQYLNHWTFHLCPNSTPNTTSCHCMIIFFFHDLDLSQTSCNSHMNKCASSNMMSSQGRS